MLGEYLGELYPKVYALPKLAFGFLSGVAVPVSCGMVLMNSMGFFPRYLNHFLCRNSCVIYSGCWQARRKTGFADIVLYNLMAFFHQLSVKRSDGDTVLPDFNFLD